MKFGPLFLGAAAAVLTSAAWAAEPPPLSVYTADPPVDSLVMAPDGTHVAFVTTLNGRRTAQIMDKSGLVMSVMAEGHSEIGGVQWASPRHLLVFSNAVVAGNDLMPRQRLSQLNIYNLGSHRSVLALSSNNDTAPILSGGRIVPGQSFNGAPTLYFRVLRAGPTFDLFRVDLDSGVGALHDLGSFDARDWVVSPSGDLVAKTTYDPSTRRWSLYARNGPSWKLIRRENTTEPPTLAGLGRAADAVTVAFEDNAAELSLTDGKPTPGATSWTDATDVEFDPRSGQPVLARLGGLTPQYRFFSRDLEAAWSKAKRAFGDKIVSLESFSSDYSQLLVCSEGADDSGSYFWVDLKTGRADLIDKLHEALKPGQVGSFRVIHYKAGDGVELSGPLTLPPGRAAKDLPLIVLPHRSLESYSTLGFDTQAQAFASRGYAVFRPNYRGSKLNDALNRAGIGQLGRAMQTDLSDAVAELARKGVVDPKRVCIVGSGSAGYMALAGVTVQTGVYRCAVAIDAPSDLSRLIHTPGSLTRGRVWDYVALLKRFTGADRPGDRRLLEISPFAQAARASAPILLIHGDDDHTVPVSQSERMQGALSAAGKASELVVVKGADDGEPTSPALREQILSAALTFVLRHNPPS